MSASPSMKLRCPKCGRYLGELWSDMRGTVDVRIPCPKCEGELQQRVSQPSTDTT